MTVETATTIDQLDNTLPLGGDVKAEGDDHIRLLKSTIQATFPNILGVLGASTTELDTLDGATLSTAELNILDGVTSTAAELNALDGYTGTFAMLNFLTSPLLIASDFDKLADITASSAEINKIDGYLGTTGDLNILNGVTATTAELNALDGYTGTFTMLNFLTAPLLIASDFTKLADITASSAEINKIDGYLGTTAELNILIGVTSDASELNTLAGFTGSAADVELLSGIAPNALFHVGNPPPQSVAGVVLDITVTKIGTDQIKVVFDDILSSPLNNNKQTIRLSLAISAGGTAANRNLHMQVGLDSGSLLADMNWAADVRTLDSTTGYSAVIKDHISETEETKQLIGEPNLTFPTYFIDVVFRNLGSSNVSKSWQTRTVCGGGSGADAVETVGFGSSDDPEVGMDFVIFTMDNSTTSIAADRVIAWAETTSGDSI